MGFIRRFILRSEEPYKRSVAIYPLTIFLAVGLDLFMVLYKAGKNNPQIKEWGLAFQIPVAWGISTVLAGIFYVFLGPFLKKRIAAKFDVDADVELSVAEEAVPAKGIDSTEKTKAEDTNEGETEMEKPKAKKSLANMAASSMKKFADSTINRDIEAEAFAPKTEEMFSYLQVLTACLLSFAHGANDVANAIAPLSAVLAIYKEGKVSSKSEVEKWVLALGGAGIVVGLALYGYKLIISLGYRMTKVSPSRGFAIELSAATVVVVASFIGIPISTTQCKVGGTTAVGMFGGKKGVDPWFLLKIVAGWVLTFFGVCAINAGVFAFAYYAPSASGFA